LKTPIQLAQVLAAPVCVIPRPSRKKKPMNNKTKKHNEIQNPITNIIPLHKDTISLSLSLSEISKP